MSTPSPSTFPAGPVLRPATVSPLSSLAWPVVFWQPNVARDARFVHVDTQVGSRRPASGTTLWAQPAADGDARVGWSWAETAPGVLALSDPMGLFSNIQYLDGAGRRLPESAATLHLNALVHALPWQAAVHRALRRAVVDPLPA